MQFSPGHPDDEPAELTEALLACLFRHDRVHRSLPRLQELGVLDAAVELKQDAVVGVAGIDSSHEPTGVVVDRDL